MNQNRERGFSLIDVMVALSLISIAAVGIGAQFIAQKKAMQSLAGKGAAAAVMKVMVNWISDNPGMFPHLPTSPGGGALVYLGCFDQRGFPVTSNEDEVKPFFAVVGKQNVHPYAIPSGRNCSAFFEVEIQTSLVTSRASAYPLVNYAVTVAGVDTNIVMAAPTGAPSATNLPTLKDSDKDKITVLRRDLIPAY